MLSQGYVVVPYEDVCIWCATFKLFNTSKVEIKLKRKVGLCNSFSLDKDILVRFKWYGFPQY